MKRKISLILIGVSFISATLLTMSYAEVKSKSIKQDIVVTFIEGEKNKDGYVEVTTRSRDVYRIYPCGKVEKLTWKEVAPNTEATTTYSIVDGSNSVLYYDGNAGAWRGR
jgi:hypothetical protein